MPAAARHLSIHGLVQGVWYRNWAIETARNLNLTGWVRNRRDGSVEVQVEGAIEAIDAFVASAYRGPPAAQVARIDVSEAPFESLEGFVRRPTV